jgi:hypothetical protein
MVDNWSELNEVEIKNSFVNFCVWVYFRYSPKLPEHNYFSREHLCKKYLIQSTIQVTRPFYGRLDWRLVQQPE